MHVNVGIFLGLVSLIIFLGFVGEIIFKKFSIVPVLIYIFIGVLLGPVFNLVDPELAIKIAPYLGAIVFSIILFEGGLEIHFSTFMKTMGKAIMFSSFVFFGTTALITALWFFIFGSLINGILLGVILGCTSAVIIVPIINRLSVSKELKTLVTLESTFTDMLTVVIAFMILNLIKNGGSEMGNNFLSSIWNTVSISVVLGLVFGFMFFRMYSSIKGSQLSYMLVLALMFGMYALVEFFHGSGPLSVLILGLIVGNAPDMFSKLYKNFRINLYKLVKLNHDELMLDEYVHRATAELSFITRVFFFVLLGMTVDFKFFTNIRDIAFVLLVFLSILIARFIGVKLLMWREKGIPKSEQNILLISMPRGLATAVMAFQPLIYGIPNAEVFIAVAFGIIILTTSVMTLGIFLHR